VVTNHHVVPRERAEVILADGRQFEGAVVARDAENDLAVLDVAAVGLAAAEIGDASRLRAGELVVAVGHPFGVRGAVTIGVVGGVVPAGAGGRELIRADVLLGPGNSGGPLADARGRVVGINAMVAGGLALAVPSYLVDRLVAASGGRASLGIVARDVALPPAMSADLPVAIRAGVLVVEVHGGGAGERAGLLMGDVLVAFDSRPLASTAALLAQLAAHTGGPIRLAVIRGGRPFQVVVEAARPDRLAA
jgi:serine protease Do